MDNYTVILNASDVDWLARTLAKHKNDSNRFEIDPSLTFEENTILKEIADNQQETYTRVLDAVSRAEKIATR